MQAICRALVLALVAALALTIAPHGVAQDKEDKKPDKKGKNKAKASLVAEAKGSPATESVTETALAHSLISYGRKHKRPEALLAAARILASQPEPKKMKDKPKTERHTKEGKEEKKTEVKRDNSPEGLVAEARKMAPKGKEVGGAATWIAREIQEIKRSPVGGPRRGYYRVPAFSTNTHTITMRGREQFVVAISGDGDTRLDLYVYDENDNYCTSHVGPGDDKIVYWVPAWTGRFQIKVVNRGSVYNDYLFIAR